MAMSRMDTPARITIKPQANVYTALAIIGALTTLGALIYLAYQYKMLIVGG